MADWTTADGRHLMVSEMSTEHIKNCMIMIMNRYNAEKASYCLASDFERIDSNTTSGPAGLFWNEWREKYAVRCSDRFPIYEKFYYELWSRKNKNAKTTEDVLCDSCGREKTASEMAGVHKPASKRSGKKRVGKTVSKRKRGRSLR